MSVETPYREFSRTPFFIFSFILLVKSYLAWLVVFKEVWPWGPLLTEVPFIWMLFCLVECFAKKRKLAWYVTINLLLTAIFFAVIMYYKYYGVIVTYHALQQVNQVTAVNQSVLSLMDPYFLFIFTDIIVLFFFLWRKNNHVLKSMFEFKRPKRSFVIPVLAFCIVACILNIWPNRASMNEIVKAEQMGILNYEAFTILSSEKQEWLDPNEITQEAIQTIKGHEPEASPEFWGAAEGKPLILIQLESFQDFLVGLEIDGQEITPNLNRLVEDHFYIPNFYQQVGQGNTSDAEFVVNTSFYIPPRGAASQMYAGKELPSLPKLMKEQGYFTSTFHTNVVEFWNRGELYEALGFDRYYDKEFFGEEDSIFFGASDEVLYKKTAEELKTYDRLGLPFYAHVISMTAHHPYTIPEEKYQMTLPERYEGTFVGDYIRSQNYADYALGLFINELKESGIWDKSLIMLYGDHLGLPVYSLDRNDQELMEEILGREYSYSDMINIPLVIVSDGLTHPRVFEQIGGQVDLLPTIANLMGISLEDHIYFGQDLLNESPNLLPQRYYLPTGSFITSDEALFMPGAGFEDGTNYPLTETDLEEAVVSKEQYERALELLKMSDSYVNQLPDRAPAADEE
ncbi:LTA synthase family protein [Paenibacillus senegalensis]|uniref:LTA synthase family protein n=1 Tax=Paenibacillus senegalensis TaxID=1465766 RepID=UPI000287B118|nr:LTA synthase family protein [Paenibacillus senegalensis]